MGCDSAFALKRSFIKISIHAPTWGATLPERRLRSMTAISIHAPTWGATDVCALLAERFIKFQSTHPRGVRPSARNSLSPFALFQSTHPRGVRPMDVKYLTGMIYISIHAPTWGATYNREGVLGRLVFQSTHPRGVRLISKKN